jgi:hypothetical protein
MASVFCYKVALCAAGALFYAHSGFKIHLYPAYFWERKDHGKSMSGNGQAPHYRKQRITRKKSHASAFFAQPAPPPVLG